MDTQRLKTTLRGIAGHLVIETKEQQRNFKRLQKSLTKSFLPDDVSQLKRTDFSIEKADLFFDEKISRENLEALDSLADRTADRQDDAKFRFFVREVPVREQLIHGSVAEWAAGAEVDHSVGPFINKDGRQFWYDFFRVENLIALYMQGIAEPVLLFKPRRRRRSRTDIDLPLRINLARRYFIANSSIWINSRFLAPNAPIGTYTGLTLRGGRVSLSRPPPRL